MKLIIRMSSRRRIYTPTNTLFTVALPTSNSSGLTSNLFSSSSIASLPQSIKDTLQKIFLPDPTNVISSLQTGTVQILNQSTVLSASASFYTLYEQYILAMIQYIIDKVSLDFILDGLNALQVQIETKTQAITIIKQIEHIILGVVDNISNRVNLNIVLSRLAYLTELLDKVDPSELPTVYSDVAELLISVIENITNKDSLDTVLSDLALIQTYMTGEVQVAREILAVQKMVISIVENITQKVNLNIVMTRLVYLQEQMKLWFPVLPSF